MSKVIKYCLIGLLFLIAQLYFVFRPNYATSLIYKSETITIQRDNYNIPSINAPSINSAMYAYGRVHAEDRLFQMAFKVLVVEGRLSEHFGTKVLPMDKFMRQLDLKGWGQKMAYKLKKQNITEYQLLQSYVDGINDFAATLIILPFDFQLIRFKWANWTVQQVFELYKLLEWSQGMGMMEQYFRSSLLANHSVEQIKKLLPSTKQDWAFDSTTVVDDKDIPDHLKTAYLQKITERIEFTPQVIEKIIQLGIFQMFKSVQGSNSWAISGEHTVSGRPMLAHDPHLQNVLPSQWYQIRSKYYHNGKQHHITGISTSGVPMLFGKTSYLSVGITTIYIDNQDLFREKIDKDKYLLNGVWRDLTLRKQIIKVKGQAEIQYIVKQTHRGPLVHFLIGSTGSYKIQDDISLQWTGFNDQYISFISSLHLAEFSQIEDAKEYLQSSTKYIFNVNILFMTADNHIGFQQGGIYPLRKNKDYGLFIKNGTTTQHDWIGFLPAQNRLQIIDPLCGYIAIANNKIASSDYQFDILGYSIYTARSDRIHQMIRQKIDKGHKFTMEDMKVMQSDTIDVYCQQTVPHILLTIPDSNHYLANFDCNISKSSWQSSMYEVFIYELHHLIKVHITEKKSILSLHSHVQYLLKYIQQAKGDSVKTEKLNTAWNNMKLNLTSFFSSNDSRSWSWGKYHHDAMHHLPFGDSFLKILYDRTFEGSGNMHTVNVGKMNKVQFGNFEVSHRANYRAIYSYSQKNLWIIDSGSSEKFFSKHYDDQWNLFQDNQYLPLEQKLYDEKNQL